MLLSGVDTDDYDWNVDWQHRYDKFQIRNSANTFGHKHRSLATAARTFTYPDNDVTIGNVPKGAAKYVIYKVSTTYFVQDINGAVVHSSTNPTTEIQWALDNLTVGRNYKEIVKPIGDFTIGQITLPDYVTLELTGSRLTLAANTNVHMITNDNHTTGNNEIDIIGGFIDGNKTNQPSSGSIDTSSTIYLKGCSNIIITRNKIVNGCWHSIRTVSCPTGILINNNIQLKRQVRAYILHRYRSC